MIAIVRLAYLLVIAFITLSFVSYLLAFIFPGVAISNLSGIDDFSKVSQAQLEQAFLFDAPLLDRAIDYIARLLSGDWGVSMVDQTPLFEHISRHLPATLELMLYALLLSFLISLPAGIYAGLRPKPLIDKGLVALSLTATSLPVFWLALVFIMFFSVHLNWFPLSGRSTLLVDVPVHSGFLLIDLFQLPYEQRIPLLQDAFLHLAVPTFTLTVITAASLFRFIRSSVREVMEKNYIVAARSRGFSETQIFFRHGLRNALLPIIPNIAMLLTTLLANTLVIETIFDWPGIGSYLLAAINHQDYTAIRIGILMVAMIVVSMSLLLDTINRLFNPLEHKRTFT